MIRWGSSRRRFSSRRSGPTGTVDPSAGYALYLDFKNSLYRSGATKVSTISTVPGYTYTRSGPKQELNGTSTLVSFAANVPGIVPNIGYWSRASLVNLVLQSNAAGTNPWAGNVSVTADVAVAPDGTTTMDKHVETATNTIQYNYQSVSTTASTVYTASRFYKMAERRYGRHSFVTGTSADGPYADFDLQTGTIVNSGALGTGTINSASIKDVGGGIYRVTVVGTVGTAIAPYMVSTIRNASTNVLTEAAQAYTGDGTSGWYSWGAQIILGNFPDGGPIIATTTATVTVGADALATSYTVPVEDYFIWGVFNIPAGNAAYAMLASFNDGTTANEIYLSRNTGNAAEIQIATSGTGLSVAPSVSLTAGGRIVLGVRYSGGNFAGAVRIAGTTTIATNTAKTHPIGLVTLKPGTFSAGTLQPNGNIEGLFRQVGTFSDAQITAIINAA